MKKILVGYDVSENSKMALGKAIDLAKDSEIEIVIIFVRSDYDRNFLNNEITDEADVKLKVKEIMTEAIKTTLKSGLKVEGVILKGDPALKIIEYSNENDVDLIILGALGITNSKFYRLGNVTEKVLRYSKKSVMIIR